MTLQTVYLAITNLIGWIFMCIGMWSFLDWIKLKNERLALAVAFAFIIYGVVGIYLKV
jgi:hypothetical protein